jgi:hypothetical protein
MKTKIRKFGTTEFVEVEHVIGSCHFCAAAKLVNWKYRGEVIFFEDEHGYIHRIESLRVSVMCEEITRELATAEIAARASQ